jgi:hypothetical protein
MHPFLVSASFLSDRISTQMLPTCTAPQHEHGEKVRDGTEFFIQNISNAVQVFSGVGPKPSDGRRDKQDTRQLTIHHVHPSSPQKISPAIFAVFFFIKIHI